MSLDPHQVESTIRRRARLSRREIVIASLLTLAAGSLLVAALVRPAASPMVEAPAGGKRAAEARR